MTNHFSLARFLLWIPPLLWYRIIWGFSAQTASASGKVSDGLLHYWRPAEIASKGPARKANCGAKEKAITEFFQILYTEQ